MKTTVGIIAAAVMSFTVVGCGTDPSSDKAKSVTLTVQPEATRPADLPYVKERGAGPRCRDPEVCMR